MNLKVKILPQQQVELPGTISVNHLQEAMSRWMSFPHLSLKTSSLQRNRTRTRRLYVFLLGTSSS